MSPKTILPILYGILAFLFLLRWVINWILLNKINKTNYSMFTFNPKETPPFMHIVISEWQIWWAINEDWKKLKKTSNFFSVLIYLCILLILIGIKLDK